MCFYDEADWHAEVQVVSMKTAEKDIRCDECHAKILAGEEYKHVFQQESECCQTCEEHEDDCKCESPDTGETFEYQCCMNCKKFLNAVAATEKGEGCPAYAQRPLLCEMIQAIGGKDEDDARKYFNTAIRMYPELKQSGYLDVMWRRMFGVAAV